MPRFILTRQLFYHLYVESEKFYLSLQKTKTMLSYVLKIDERKVSGKILIDYLKSLSEKTDGIDLIREIDKPYNKEFVQQIQNTMKTKGQSVKVEDLWK